MFRIRHYHETLHPDSFAKGVRGWWIRALNWLRWKLEVRVQRHVVKYLIKHGQVPNAQQLLRRFEVDVREEVVRKDSTSPRLLNVEVPPVPSEINARSARYEAGRQRSVLDTAKTAEDVLPSRPVAISDMASRYGSPPRQQRYAFGRRHVLLHEDGDFTPLQEEGS